jgi:nucleoside 2-deoxyribosyltransferase
VRVYLAGPINGSSDDEVFGWRNALIDRHADITFVDPTVRDYRGREAENVEDIVEGDKGDIDSCEVFVAHCPKPSVGTSMEVFYSWQLGMPTIVWVPEEAPVSPWLACHSHQLVRTEADLDAVLRESVDAASS